MQKSASVMSECCAGEYLIKDKINLVMSENASNMRKAFQARLSPEDPCDARAHDPQHIWEGCQKINRQSMPLWMRTIGHGDRSMHMVRKDGLKDTSGLPSTTAKLSSFKDHFEALSGDATIPRDIATW